jgi:Fe-S oxidoreductase
MLSLAGEGTLRRCYDCGKCTSVCPLNLGERLYSPRRLGQIALEDPGGALREALWECLTCGACKDVCPAGVDFPGFVRRARALLPGDAVLRECSHGGALQTIQRLTAEDSQRQNRLAWVPAGARWTREGATLLFTGSAPYYDRYFDYLGVDAAAAPRAALRILNRLDLEPVLLEQERTSGHDLLFAGDEEGFRRVAALNFAAMREAGVKRVVTACAESYHVLACHYPRVLPGFSLEVQHFLPFLEREIAGRRLALEPVPRTVTYHDPCRLARLSGVIAAPRRLLARVPGLRFVEMRRSGARALCCGTSAWLRCGAVNRTIQGERLREAADTGSDTLLSACPKCLIHLRCAQADLQADPQGAPQGATDPRLRLEDITALLARAIAPEERGGTA